MFIVIKPASLDGHQDALVPDALQLIVSRGLLKVALPVRPAILEGALVDVFDLLLGIVLEDLQSALPAPLPLVELPFIILPFALLHSLPVTVVLAVVPLVLVVMGCIFEAALAVEGAPIESTLVCGPVAPVEPAYALLFPLEVVSFVQSLIALLDTSAMRLLVHPAALVVEAGGFVGVDAGLGASADKVAAVVVDEEALIEVRLEAVSDLALVVASELPVLLGFVELDVPPRQLVLERGLLVGVDQVVGVLQPPDLLRLGIKLRQLPDALLHAVAHAGHCVSFGPQRRVPPHAIPVLVRHP